MSSNSFIYIYIFDIRGIEIIHFSNIYIALTDAILLFGTNFIISNSYNYTF